MGFFANLFGTGEKVDTSAATLKPQGVKVIDVRSRGEYQGGHIAGAKSMDVGSLRLRPGREAAQRQAHLPRATARAGAARRAPRERCAPPV